VRLVAFVARPANIAALEHLLARLESQVAGRARRGRMVWMVGAPIFDAYSITRVS
jgi:hypothetical protein